MFEWLRVTDKLETGEVLEKLEISDVIKKFIDSLIAEIGHIPLPPYINRDFR